MRKLGIFSLLLFVAVNTPFFALAQTQSVQRPAAGEHPLERLRFLLGRWNCEYFSQTTTGFDYWYSSTITYRLMPGDQWIGSEEVITGSKQHFTLGWNGSNFIELTNGPDKENPSAPLHWYSADDDTGGYAGWLNGFFTLQRLDGRAEVLKIQGPNKIEWDWPVHVTESHGLVGKTSGGMERCTR
jgi:hypothetical protein